MEHWKMVSDDIGIEEPNMVRLANPNRLNFEGLEHLVPNGLLKASFLQKSGVTNAMETFLIEEKKNVNQRHQNWKQLINRTSGTEVIQNLDNPQKVIKFLPTYQKDGKINGIMSTEEFESKFTNWISDTEVIQNLDNPQKVSSTLSTHGLDGLPNKFLDQIKTMASNLSLDVSRSVDTEGGGGPVGHNRTGGPSRLNKFLDQIKTMASNMSLDGSRAVVTEGAGGPVGPNRTGGPSRLNEGCMDQLTETMASNMSKDENRTVDTGGAKGPPMGASGTGVWCNGVWFPTFGETIEDLDDFINPSMDENQESNGPMETFLKNRASGSEVNQDLNPRKVSSTLTTQNLEGMDQLAETMASSMSMGAKKAIKKTKNVAMAGILRQAAARSPSAGVESRADGHGGAGGVADKKGTRVIQDLNPRKVSSTLSIQERLDQIKSMASNMSMDENRAGGTEGAGGPVGPNRTGGSSTGILRQTATRGPSASVENKALGVGGAGGANGAKGTRVIFVPHQIKTMSSNMSVDENRAVGTESTGGPMGPNRTGGSSGILRQAETRSPSASVENKPLGPGAASAADFAKRVKATPDFGLHLRLRDGAGGP